MLQCCSYFYGGAIDEAVKFVPCKLINDEKERSKEREDEKKNWNLRSSERKIYLSHQFVLNGVKVNWLLLLLLQGKEEKIALSSSLSREQRKRVMKVNEKTSKWECVSVIKDVSRDVSSLPFARSTGHRVQFNHFYMLCRFQLRVNYLFFLVQREWLNEFVWRKCRMTLIIHQETREGRSVRKKRLHSHHQANSIKWCRDASPWSSLSSKQQAPWHTWLILGLQLSLVSWISWMHCDTNGRPDAGEHLVWCIFFVSVFFSSCEAGVVHLILFMSHFTFACFFHINATIQRTLIQVDLDSSYRSHLFLLAHVWETFSLSTSQERVSSTKSQTNLMLFGNFTRGKRITMHTSRYFIGSLRDLVLCIFFLPYALEATHSQVKSETFITVPRCK